MQCISLVRHSPRKRIGLPLKEQIVAIHLGEIALSFSSSEKIAQTVCMLHGMRWWAPKASPYLV